MATSCTGERTKADLTQTCYFHRKEVTLQAGSVLKIRGHPRDLVQVWLNILILNFRPGEGEQSISRSWSGDGERGEREPSSSHNVSFANDLWKLGSSRCRVHFCRRDRGGRIFEVTFTSQTWHHQGCEEFCTLDLMVENLGRANFGSPHNFEQKKGLWEGDVLLDERILDDWEHISIEPTGAWLDQLQGWREYNR